jgi:hypothetical protein
MPNTATVSAAKKHLFTHALSLGDVNVQFLPATPGVEVPAFLDVTGVQVFTYGLNQPVPIPDLVIGIEGIRATLSFGRQPHMTFVPWIAVGALVGELYGIVFPMTEAGAQCLETALDSIPEVATEVAPEPASEPVRAPGRPRLSLVP